MAKAEVYKDRRDQYHFRIKANNNKIVAASKEYTRKSSCVDGLISLMKACMN